MTRTPTDDGFVRVPSRFAVSADALRALQFVAGGHDGPESWCDATFWIGEVTDDDGNKVYGLHVTNDECPEEGSATVAEFAAPAPPNLRTTPESAETAAAPFVWIAYHPDHGYAWGNQSQVGRWDEPPALNDGWVWHKFGRMTESAERGDEPPEGATVTEAQVEAACVAYYGAPAWEFMSHKAGCLPMMRAALLASGLPAEVARLLEENESLRFVAVEYEAALLRQERALNSKDAELATARADNARLAAEVERLKGELAEARKAPAEVAVTEAMVRRFVEEANPMIHPLPPPGVVRSALQAALASWDEPTKGMG